jgi:hypothetical protein
MNTEKNLIYINSKDRISGTSSDFEISFSDLQLTSSEDSDLYLQLVDCVIPNSFYNINTNNNQFELNSTVLTISPGNYNIKELISELNTQIKSVDTHLTASYNSITSIVKIHHNSSHTSTLNFDVDNSIHDVLGFEKQSYTIAGNSDLFGTGLCNIGTDICLYLHSNIPNQNLMSLPDSEHLQKSTILSRIPILVPHFSNIYFNSSGNENYRQKLPHKRLDTINFKITDSKMRTLELNDDFVLTVSITRVPKRDKANDELLNLVREIHKIEKLKFISE